MIRNSAQRCGAIFITAYVFAVGTGIACQVPVFRYALERWSADAYQLDVLYSESLDSSLSEALNALETESANIKVRTFDVNKLTESDQWRIGELPAESTLPSFRLFSPDIDQESQALWTASASVGSLKAITDSPIRKRIVEELASGVSAIWFIVPGNKSSDGNLVDVDTVEQQLLDNLKQLSDSMSLPDGVINAGEIDNEAFRPEQPIDLDDVLRSHVPLKLDFSVLRLDPDDPAEQVTVRLLSPLVPPGGGVVPVFGRGRALPGIPLNRIGPKVLERAAEYIVGSCSCQVKAENPGVDLLIQADWDALLTDQLVVSSRDLPPLEGIGIIKDENHIAIGSSNLESMGSIPSKDEANRKTTNPLRRNMLIAAIAFIVVSGIGAVWLGRSNS